MKKLKYKYERILQQNNGNGWDDVESWETASNYVLSKEDSKSLKRLKAEYKIAQKNATLRVISRKTAK